MKKITTAALVGLVAVSSAASASMARWNGFGDSSLFVGDVQDIWTLPAVVAANKDASYFEFGTPAGLGGSTVNNSVTGAAWGGSHMSLGPVVLAIWGNRPYKNFGLLASNIGTGASGTLNVAFAAPSLFGPAANNTTAAPILAGAAGAPAGSALTHQLDLIVAFALGDMATIGVGINTSSSGGKVVNDSSGSGNFVKNTIESSNNDLGINIGADLKDLGPIALLEIGLQYDSRNDMSSDALDANFPAAAKGTNKNTQVGSEINLRIGGDIKGEGGKGQRFEVGYDTQALEYKSEAEGFVAGVVAPYNSLKRTASSWGLGWAMNMTNDKGMGLGGFILSGQSFTNSAPFSATNLETNTGATPTGVGGPLTAAGTETNKNAMDKMMLQFVSGGEAKLKDWCAARAGFSTVMFGTSSSSYEVAGGTNGTFKRSNTSNANAGGATLSTGASLMFGDITLDGTLNQDFLFSGPFFTNGVAEQLFGQVSATWGWGGGKE